MNNGWLNGKHIAVSIRVNHVPQYVPYTIDLVEYRRRERVISLNRWLFFECIPPTDNESLLKDSTETPYDL
jgi:hypothetical protein